MARFDGPSFHDGKPSPAFVLEATAAGVAEVAGSVADPQTAAIDARIKALRPLVTTTGILLLQALHRGYP
jgi:hypothetical protein